MALRLFALVTSALGGGVRLRVSACRPRGRRHPALSRVEVSNGRLDHPRSLDVVRSAGRSLIGTVACVGVVGLAGLFAPGTARAAGVLRSTALSQCQASVANANAVLSANHSPYSWAPCVDHPNGLGGGYFDSRRTDGATGATANYDTTDPVKDCKSQPSPSGTTWDSGYVTGSTVCVESCEFAFTQTPGTITVSVTGKPDIGRTSGTFAPDGKSCTADSAPSPPASQPPQVCSGGSCYDPNANKFCSVSSSGAQTCVSGPTDPGGGAPPQQPPACAVNGAAASCAGDAGQPPPTPPNPPVTDPQQQQTGSGSFNGAGVGGGITITTGTYLGTTAGGSGGDGGTTTPGGGSGGDGTGGDGTGDGDGGDGDGDGDTKCTAGKVCNDAYTEAECGADPSTAGDPLLATMAVEAHRQRCRDLGVQQELGTADKSMGTDHEVGEVFKDDTGTTPAFDSSGFLGGGGSCPGLPHVEYAGQEVLSADGMCETAPILAGFVLFAAYVVAALVAAGITSGSKG